MDAKAKQNKKKEISTPMYDEKRRGVRITKEEKAQRELNAHTHKGRKNGKRTITITEKE